MASRYINTVNSENHELNIGATNDNINIGFSNYILGVGNTNTSALFRIIIKHHINNGK